MVDVFVTLLALRALPAVHLQVGAHAARMPRKTVGMLTGSASAAAAGHFPPLDLALICLPTWQNSGLGLEIGADYLLCVCTFVDSFVVLSQRAKHNAFMLDHAEAHLWRTWGLRFGQTSSELVPCGSAGRVASFRTR